MNEGLLKELGELAAGVEYRKCFETTFGLNNRCVRCSEQYQSTEKRFTLQIAYPASKKPTVCVLSCVLFALEICGYF